MQLFHHNEHLRQEPLRFDQALVGQNLCFWSSNLFPVRLLQPWRTENLQCLSLESSCREALQLHPETITVFNRGNVNTSSVLGLEVPHVCVAHGSLPGNIHWAPSLAWCPQGERACWRACILLARCVADLHLRPAWGLSGHPWNPVTHLWGICSDYIKKSQQNALACSQLGGDASPMPRLRW